MDVDDDYATTRAALAGHDPVGGRVVVDPTPAAKGLLVPALDVLAALGMQPRYLVGYTSPHHAWRQVAAWIGGRQVEQVIVLRAHLLPRLALARFMHLAAETGASVTFVWHAQPPADWQEVLPAATLAVLDSVQEAFGRALRPRRRGPRPQPMYCPNRSPVPAGVADSDPAVRAADALQRVLPALPATELPRFRAELLRRLGLEDFAHADSLYTHGMDAACAFLTAHPSYQPPLQRPTSWATVTAPPDPDGPGRDETGDGGPGTEPGDRCGHAGDHTAATGDSHRVIGQQPALYPVPWQDPEGLCGFLVALLAPSTSPSHSLVLLRGAQAGFLLHGLLLMVPPDPVRLGGPGFSAVAPSRQVVDRIRARVAHPARAAALALLLATGLAADELGKLRVADVPEDGSTTRIGPWPWWPGEQQVIFPVPVHLRDLVAAARTYALLAGAGEQDPLLGQGLGPGNREVFATARLCDLPLLETERRLRRGEYWLARVGCMWVADPIHDNLAGRGGTTQGWHVPQA